MKPQTLMENLSKLGLSYLMPSKKVDVNATLAEVVKSDDMRLWEGFPVLLASAVKESVYSSAQVVAKLDLLQRLFFHGLLLMSLAVFEFSNQESSWSKKFKKKLSNDDKQQIKEWRNCLAHGRPLSVSGQTFSSERLLKTFYLYAAETGKKAKKDNALHAELALEHSLSQIFKPRQKEILKKKLEGLPLTKTEAEYYSRSIKKKVVALANEDLHSLAKRILGQR